MSASPCICGAQEVHGAEGGRRLEDEAQIKLHVRVVAPQMEIESKTWKQFIALYRQALKT
jgi:hypothetical protein